MSSIDYSFIHDAVIEIERLFDGVTTQQHYAIERACQDIARNEHRPISTEANMPCPMCEKLICICKEMGSYTC